MFQDWISVFQLGAALSFVLGGFANHRQPREDKLERWEKEAVDQIAQLLRSDGREVPRLVEKGVMLDTVHWSKMSTTDLNDYRRDVTRRYYARIERYKSNDRIRQALLWINGLVCSTALIYGSANGEQQISGVLAVVIALVILGIPVAAMVSVWIEDNYLVREGSPSNRNGARDNGRTAHERSNPAQGQAFHVFTEIRRRVRALKDKGDIDRAA